MTLRIGVIGVGGIARSHVRRLRELPDAVVAALADPSPASLQALRHAVDLPPEVREFDDYRAMLAGIELEAVLVASPHTLHHEHIVAALDAGLHVLAEKPLVHTADLARDVAARAQAAGREVVVGFQRRFTPEYRQARHVIACGQLGEIRHVSAVQAQNWMAATAGTWRQTQALGGGGQLSDSGSHLVDMILWTTGRRVVEVVAHTRAYGGEVEIDGAATLRLDNGAIGTLSVVGSAQRFWERLALFGERGSVRVDYASGAGYTFARDAVAGDLAGAAPHALPAGTDPDAHFVAVVRGEVPNESPPADIIHVLEVIEAIRESAARGRPSAVGGG